MRRVPAVAVVALLLTVLVAPAVLAVPVAAQDALGTDTPPEPGSEPVNASEIDTSQIEKELGTVTVHKTVFHDDNTVSIFVTVEGHSGPISVTDSGAVDVGSNERRSVPFEVYRPGEGVHELRFFLGSDDQLITVQEGAEMMVASGDRTTLDILSTAPTTDIVRWATVSGGIGTTIALGLVVGGLRRRHQNTYKELFAEERVKIEENPVQGILGHVQRFITRNRYALLLAAVIVSYLVATRLGVVPTAGEAWTGATDAQRVIIVGSGVMSVLMLPVVYALAVKLWDPAKEFIVDVDARDVLDPSLGSNSGLTLDADTPEEVADELDERDDLDVVAVYSGAPERVSKMRVDGSPAEARTPGGRGHIVQDFDPKRNAGVGCWPGTASDVELISDRSKIDGNREILRDESRMLRTLIGALPAIATASDTDAMRAVDRELRQLVNVDSGPIDGLLNRAAAGTRFEGQYGDDDNGDSEDEDGENGLADLIDPRDDDEDEEEEDK